MDTKPCSLSKVHQRANLLTQFQISWYDWSGCTSEAECQEIWIMIPPCKNQNVVTILTILCFVLDGICSVLRLVGICSATLWQIFFFMRKTIRRSALLDRLGQSANMRMSARAQKLGLFLSVDVDDIQTVRTNQNPRERVFEKGNRP